LRALKVRNYRLFVAGQLVSLVGTWTQTVAQSWLVYRLTGSALWLGMVTFCQQAPSFLLATLGGLLADRYRRRTILVVTQSSSMALAFVLAALTLSGRVQVVHVAALAVLLGAIGAVDSPTRQAFVLEMVGREDLTNAIGFNASMVMCASFVGPAIAGVAIKALGEGWCFVANGVSFLAVIAGLLAMRGLPPATAGAVRESMRVRLLEGFRFAGTNQDVRALLVLLAVTALAGFPFGTLMPLFASTVLHGDARTLGVLMGAPGLGAMSAGLLLPVSDRVENSYRRIATACGAFGLLLVLFALSRTVWVAVAILLPAGAATMVQVTATNASIQRLTPDALRGRVMALWTMVLMGFVPVGSLIAGSLATAFDPRLPLIAGGLVCTLGAIGFGRWVWRRHRVDDRPTEALRDPRGAEIAPQEGREA
jgi:MFS family permease